MQIGIDTPLVFSMGFNGYQWIYRRNIASHRAYAAKHGYEYVMVDSPAFTPLLMECAWLKLQLLAAALEAGRPWVLFLDADVQIANRAPSVETMFQDGKALYLGKGHSGRVNSGVMIGRNDPQLIQLIHQIVANALRPVPPEDDVGWGENGHVIHFAKNHPTLQIIDVRWNNTRFIELDDYFRHFTGALKARYEPGLIGRCAGRLARFYVKLMRKLGYRDDPNLFFGRLSRLTSHATGRYRQFRVA